MEDIPLPKYDKSLNITVPKDSSITIKFTPITTAYKSMKGKFLIPIEIPNLNKTKVVSTNQAAPNVRLGGNRLNSTAYKTGNTLILEIPKYLVMMFDNKIPKGTKFLIASLGEETDADNIRIISLYNEAPSQLQEVTYTTTTNNTVLGGGK
jgi:hypothetical protein